MTAAQIFPASELCITDDVRSRAHELTAEMPWGATFGNYIWVIDGVENLYWQTLKRETILDLLPPSTCRC